MCFFSVLVPLRAIGAPSNLFSPDKRTNLQFFRSAWRTTNCNESRSRTEVTVVNNWWFDRIEECLNFAMEKKSRRTKKRVWPTCLTDWLGGTRWTEQKTFEFQRGSASGSHCQWRRSMIRRSSFPPPMFPCIESDLSSLWAIGMTTEKFGIVVNASY